MRARHLVLAGLISAGAIVLANACGGGSPSSNGSGSSPGTNGNSSGSGSGQLAVSLVDAASQDVNQLVVNITKVTAHSTADGWITVASFSPSITIDLLELKAAANELGLGTVNVRSGQITQIRLYTTQEGNWVHVKGDTATTHTPLVVPSGYQSGIKINGPWNVVACSRTAVTLDFDGQHSIQVHPIQRGSEWILRPVIRVKKVDTTPVGCEDGGTDGGNASSCDASHPCVEGQVCVSGTCISNTPFPTGSTCTSNQECMTNNCTAQKCAPGGPGAPCHFSTDCTSNVCQNGACGGGNPAGAGCTSNSECISNECSQTCQPGVQGDPCGSTSPCQTNLTCAGGVCQPSLGL